jgi:hypothetical protein
LYKLASYSLNWIPADFNDDTGAVHSGIENGEQNSSNLVIIYIPLMQIQVQGM